MKPFIGLLSGTSLDAIDAVLVQFDEPKVQLVAAINYPYPTAFKKRCLDLIQAGRGTLSDIGSLDAWAGELFAEAALALLRQADYKAEQIAAIGSHGQTLWHQPYGPCPFSWQIGDPNIITERTQIPVVADFRRRDMAVGGQGAPLVPGLHQVLFTHPEIDRLIINLGGIANITYCPAQGGVPYGFDSGPANCLLDASSRRYLNKDYDAGGEWARGGQIYKPLLQAALTEDFFHLTAPKSTGLELFNWSWWQALCDKQKERLSPQDSHATLLALTVESLSQSLEPFLTAHTELYVCGGGAHNTFLLESLERRLQCTVSSTALLGVHPDWLEGILFAWLAKRRYLNQASNLPSVTGAQKSVCLGGVYGHFNSCE